MKNSKELIQQRQDRILQLLRQKQLASVAELATHFHVTPATIRRDLEALEEQGCLKRFFGGVEYILPQSEYVRYQLDRDDQTPVKQAIAKRAAAMIANGDTVFLNSSSTTLFILDYLDNISASIITNNARAIDCNIPEGVDLILTGGEVYGNRQSLVGEFAQDATRKVIASKCFLGVNGISAARGVTSSYVQEVAVNRSMIAHCAGQKIVVADSTKIGIMQSFFDYGLDQITHLITDNGADPKELDAIREKGVEVIVVEVKKEDKGKGLFKNRQ